MKRDLITTNTGVYCNILDFGGMLAIDDVLFTTNSLYYLYYMVDSERYWWLPHNSALIYSKAESRYVETVRAYRYNVGEKVGGFTVIAQLPYLWDNTDVCYVVKSRGGRIDWVQEPYVGIHFWTGYTRAERGADV